MRSAKTRFPGGLAWRVAYPADVPALRAIRPKRIRVPILCNLADAGALPPPGSIVAPGDRLIAHSGFGPAVLAPLPGHVVGQTTVVLSTGQTVPAVEIAVDETPADLPADPDLDPAAFAERLSAAHTSHLPDWIDLLAGAGLWADRPACPNLSEQLFQASRRPIDYVICCLLEQDSVLPLSSILAARFPAQIAAGVALLTRLSAAAHGMIVIEDQLPGRWRSSLDQAARKLQLGRIALPGHYPQSDPSMMLLSLLKRKLRPGRSPVEKGVLLLDAAAALAVGRCALAPRPMLSVPAAICDAATRTMHYLSVPIGTSLRDLLSELAIAARDDAPIVAGDPLRQRIIPRDAAIAGGDLVFHVLPPQPARIPSACIRCAWCIDGCPTHLNPAGILEGAQEEDPELAERYGVEACIECGVCDYVCPSGLPLLAAARSLKAMVRREGM